MGWPSAVSRQAHGSYLKIPALGVGARPTHRAATSGTTAVVRDVAPGRTGSAVVSTKSTALEAGSVTVAKRGEPGLTAGYPAADCA